MKLSPWDLVFICLGYVVRHRISKFYLGLCKNHKFWKVNDWLIGLRKLLSRNFLHLRWHRYSLKLPSIIFIVPINIKTSSLNAHECENAGLSHSRAGKSNQEVKIIRCCWCVYNDGYSRSKKQYTWNFLLNGKKQTVDLVVSFLTGKKKVYLNERMVHSQQK